MYFSMSTDGHNAVDSSMAVKGLAFLRPGPVLRGERPRSGTPASLPNIEMFAKVENASRMSFASPVLFGVQLSEMRRPSLLKLVKEDDDNENRIPDKNVKPDTILHLLYGDDPNQYETVNRIFHDLCGERRLQGENSEVIDRAMDKWLSQLEMVKDQHNAPLFYVKIILVESSTISEHYFNALYDTVKESEVAQFLLLDLAILFDATRVVEWVLNKGVVTESTLKLMIQCRSVECVSKYVSRFAGEKDLNELSFDKNEPWAMAPIHYAVKSGHEAIVKCLLDSGHVAVDRVDEGQATPLLLAVAGGDLEVTQLLLRYGANPFTKNSADESPLNYAIDSIAGKRTYDLETNSWKVEIDPDESGSREVVDQIVAAAFAEPAAFFDQSTLQELDHLMFRLMSANEDQTDNLKAMLSVRNWGADKLFTEPPPLVCNSKGEAEAIFTTGHDENRRFALEEARVQFTDEEP